MRLLVFLSKWGENTSTDPQVSAGFVQKESIKSSLLVLLSRLENRSGSPKIWSRDLYRLKHQKSMKVFWFCCFLVTFSFQIVKQVKSFQKKKKKSFKWAENYKCTILLHLEGKYDFLLVWRPIPWIPSIPCFLSDWPQLLQGLEVGPKSPCA